MTKPKIGLMACLVFIALGGAACSSAELRTHIVSVAITGGVSLTNEPEDSVAEIASSAPVIYLSAQVANPTDSTQVRVKWIKSPNQVILTEDFVGNRQSGNQFEVDRTKTVSALASRITKSGISWEIGEYQAEVWLGRALAKIVPFQIITDTKANQLSVQRTINQISLSDALDSQDRVGASKTIFDKATNMIYVQVELARPVSDEIHTSVRHLASDQTITTFTTVPVGTNPLVFTLSRERFGRLWSNKLWPTGTFEVTVRI